MHSIHLLICTHPPNCNLLLFFLLLLLLLLHQCYRLLAVTRVTFRDTALLADVRDPLVHARVQQDVVQFVVVCRESGVVLHTVHRTVTGTAEIYGKVQPLRCVGLAVLSMCGLGNRVVPGSQSVSERQRVSERQCQSVGQ
jgi:hypothetical protein